MRKTVGTFLRQAKRVLEARSDEERADRIACAIALLLVAAAAAVGHVTGLTLHGAPFTLYGLAVALAAARGGFLPALVAALAAILSHRVLAEPAPASFAQTSLFFVEAISVAFVVCALRSRFSMSAARVNACESTIAGLEEKMREARLLEKAFGHMEEFSDESALVVLDVRGTIVGWRTGAARLYGYSAQEMVGKSAALLFADTVPAPAFASMLRRFVQDGEVRRVDRHRRRDGAELEVDLQIRALRADAASGFSLVVRDIARDREWAEYREAAVDSQTALQRSADEARNQLAALESLTDPSLNPLGGNWIVTELLERLRTITGADGAALLRPGRAADGVLPARGLCPVGRSTMGEFARLTPGRVELVQNDASRVGQLSAFQWPTRVASLLAVPVVHDAQVWSVIELVSERPRRVSDWDVALARIVADRLAPLVVSDRSIAARAS